MDSSLLSMDTASEPVVKRTHFEVIPQAIKISLSNIIDPISRSIAALQYELYRPEIQGIIKYEL